MSDKFTPKEVYDSHVDYYEKNKEAMSGAGIIGLLFLEVLDKYPIVEFSEAGTFDLSFKLVCREDDGSVIFQKTSPWMVDILAEAIAFRVTKD